MKRHVHIGSNAKSAIEVDVIDGQDDDHDPPSYAVLRAHFQDGKLIQPTSMKDAEALHDALTELSNSHDAIAEDKTNDPEERKFARSASKQFGTSASTMIRAAREEHAAKSDVQKWAESKVGGSGDERDRDDQGRFA